MMDINELPDKYKKQVAKQLALDIKGRVSGKAPKPEYPAHKTLANNPQTPKIGTSVYLVVLMYRIGIRWDLDNASFKPILDALVQNGILEDDSTKQIKGIIKLPLKCKTKSEERTVLEFWDADYFGGFIEEGRGIRKGE